MEILWIIVLGATLLALIAVLVIALVSAVFHFRQAVAFVPTCRAVADTMIDLAALKSGDTVYDLGAGDGRVLERALERVPGIRAVGYEGALGIWMLGKIRQIFGEHRPVLIRRDFFTANLRDADVVFTYLGPKMMERLRPKLEAELKPGARVISNTFTFQSWQPTETRAVAVPFFGQAEVHLYIR